MKTIETKVKRTPGPWSVNMNVITAWRKEKHICSNMFGIVKVRNWEANARLIAAAPELLEACKAALISMSDEAYYQYMKPVIQTLEIAIRKAEGK